MIKRYQDRVPIIVESKTVSLSKDKFLVPNDISMLKFLSELRTHLDQKLNVNEALFLITQDNRTVSLSRDLASVYEEYKESCGFLYFYLEKENTYG